MTIKKTIDRHGDAVLLATPEFVRMSAAEKIAEIEGICGAAEELTGLSEGERQVVFAGMAGMRSAEIAEFAGRTAATVDVMRTRALRKTGSTTLAQLATKILGRE